MPRCPPPAQPPGSGCTLASLGRTQWPVGPGRGPGGGSWSDSVPQGPRPGWAPLLPGSQGNHASSPRGVHGGGALPWERARREPGSEPVLPGPGRPCCPAPSPLGEAPYGTGPAQGSRPGRRPRGRYRGGRVHGATTLSPSPLPTPQGERPQPAPVPVRPEGIPLGAGQEGPARDRGCTASRSAPLPLGRLRGQPAIPATGPGPTTLVSPGGRAGGTHQ